MEVPGGFRSPVPTRGEWVYGPTVSLRGRRLVYQDIWFEKNIWQVERRAESELGLATEPLITSSRWDCEAHYSPDGERLAFTSSRSGNLEIWTCNADGSRPAQLTRFGGPYLGSPRWSPDGDRIAFYACVDGFGDLYLVHADGGQPQRLTRRRENELLSSWSRDGEWIYYASDRTGDWQIWKMHPDNLEAHPVQVTSGGGIAACEWPDGRTLYYTRPDSAGLWRVSLEEGGGTLREPDRVLQDLPQLGEWGNWALSGEGILLARHDEEGPLLVIHRPQTGETETITRVPNIASPSLEISPDGRYCLYARVDRSVSDLMLVEEFH